MEGPFIMPGKGDVQLKQFIDDMIHMTEGERLIAYWWLWLLIIVAVSLLYLKIGKKG